MLPLVTQCMKISASILPVLGMVTICVGLRADTLVVMNTEDSGPGSFREKISNSLANPGPDIIMFSNVTGSITLLTPLPPLSAIPLRQFCLDGNGLIFWAAIFVGVFGKPWPTADGLT